MSEARNDRNTVQFGPSRTPQSYQLDRLEESVKDLERETVESINNTTQEITNYVDQSITNIVAELAERGTVVTYDTSQNIPTYIKGLELTFSGSTGMSSLGLFYNATGFGLQVGDQITLWPVTSFDIIPPVNDDGDPVDYIAISKYSGYTAPTPYFFNNPQANEDFPYEGQLLPTPHNPFPNTATTTFSPTIPLATIRGFYDAGVLGYMVGLTPQRVVVMIGDDTLSGSAQPPITIHNVDTGVVTDINRTAAVGTTNRTRALGAVGTRLFVTYDGTSGNCVESWNSSTGTWSTHAISHAVFAGVSDSRAWWVGYSSGGTRFRVHSIDESGIISSIDYPTSISFTSGIGSTATSYIFAKAKNGKIWVDLDTTSVSQVMAVANTNVDAASLSFTTFSTPNDLPWSRVGNGAGTTNYYDMTKAETFSDIDTDGNLYYLTRTGTPTTWGYGIIDAATLVVTRYGTVTSITGNVSDGEIGAVGGLTVVGGEVVLFGSLREDVATFPDPGRSTSYVPAYWRVGGFSTLRVYDSGYVGLSSQASGDLAAFSRLIPSYSHNDAFVYIKNIADYPFGTINNVNDAKTTGLSIVDRVGL